MSCKDKKLRVPCAYCNTGAYAQPKIDLQATNVRSVPVGIEIANVSDNVSLSNHIVYGSPFRSTSWSLIECVQEKMKDAPSGDPGYGDVEDGDSAANTVVINVGYNGAYSPPSNYAFKPLKDATVNSVTILTPIPSWSSYSSGSVLLYLKKNSADNVAQTITISPPSSATAGKKYNANVKVTAGETFWITWLTDSREAVLEHKVMSSENIIDVTEDIPVPLDDTVAVVRLGYS